MRFPWKNSKSEEATRDKPTQDATSDNASKRSSAVLAEETEKHLTSDTVHVKTDDLPATSDAMPGDSKEPVVARTASNATASSAGPGEDDESKYMQGLPLYLLTIGLVLSTFCIALDNTILATAIPKITTVFNSLNDVGWYGSSYLLTTCSLQPPFGRIYQFFSIKWTYIVALLIFEIGSIICGAAVNSPMLIIGRAIAGIGAAALFSGGMTIIAYAVPLRKRPIFIGLLSSLFGIASIVGPILGGAFTDRVSWRWCFYINLPIGALAILAVLLFFHDPERPETKLKLKQKLKEIDMVGAFLLVAAITCLLLALQWGGTTYPWRDSRVWGSLLGFGLILAVFIAVQSYLGDRAMIPPRILLRQRTVFACAFFSAFLSMALYVHIFYLPFYFQAVKGTTAEGSGIRTIPYLVSNTIASLVVGGAITAFGPYVPFIWIGSAIFCVGSGMLHTLKVSSGAGEWIGYQILAGAGAGMCIQIPFIAVQVVLKKRDIPIGNSIAIFFNSLGGALSISIAQNIFVNKLIQELPKYAPDVNAWTIVVAGATHLKDVTPPGSLPGVLEAYNIAVTSAFILSIACAGVAFLLSGVFEWKSVKGQNLLAGAA